MRREIKFRAWLQDKKEMLYQDFNTASAMNGLEMFAIKVSEQKGYTPQVMQFTCLKDKNGKEIYEGDIVKTEWRSQQGVVEWSMGGFVLKDGLMVINTLYQLQYNKWGFEVIANIWENPELINEKGE